MQTSREQRERKCTVNRTFQAIIAAVVVVLGLQEPGFAQTHDKGSMRLSLGGSISSHETFVEGQTTGRTTSDAQFMGEFGYFFANGLELAAGLSANASWVSNNADSDYGIVRGEALLKYYLVGESELVPYIGVKGGFTTVTVGDYTYTDPHVGGKLGVEYLVDENTSFFVEYDLSARFHSDNNVNTTTVTNQGNVGLTFYF